MDGALSGDSGDAASARLYSRGRFSRFCAIWRHVDGDNKASSGGHLRDSVPMLLSMGVFGFGFFAGADVGGFFGDPDAELFAPMVPAGSLYPFFRGHGHIDTKRRELWLFGEPWTRRMRDAIRTRYLLLPYVYTLFYEAATEATPVRCGRSGQSSPTMSPRGQWMISSCSGMPCWSNPSPLLGPPLHRSISQRASGTTGSPTLHWPEDRDGESSDRKIPIFIRGGTVLSTKERARRNSALMVNDPYTLTVALDDNRTARGKLFRRWERAGQRPIRGRPLPLPKRTAGAAFALFMTVDNKGYACDNVVERVVVVGIPEAARSKLTKVRLLPPAQPIHNSQLSRMTRMGRLQYASQPPG